MKRADLHVHSKHSAHPSDWLFQHVGAAESYTDPEEVYRSAIARGMDFVTLTDHNSVAGALELHAAHPERTFTGLEATACFPEDGCKVHLLVYGLTENQFREIDQRRGSIYALRDYVREEDLAHAVAHATYAVNQRLSADHLEKLVLLFDVFEGRNGARDELRNGQWTRLLQALTPEMIQRLRARHGIEPMSDTPWIKGFTGGSDDHAGLFIGSTYTCSHAQTPQAFLEALRDKRTVAGGRNSNYRALAFSIYKIVYDYAKARGNGATTGFVGQLAGYLFQQQRMSRLERLRLSHYRRRATSPLDVLIAELTARLQEGLGEDVDARIEVVYDRVARITDEIVRLACEAFRAGVRGGNVVALYQTVSLALPGAMLSVPFLTTFKHLHGEKPLLGELAGRLGMRAVSAGGKRILWFTDTLADMNGVSVTLRETGWRAFREGRDFRLVTSLLPEEASSELPPNVIVLPVSYHFPLPLYETLRLKVPSVLTCLKELFAFDPDEIIVSSPGPLGLLGLLVARLLGVPCRGLYHTDFASEAASLAPDESVAEIVEAYTRWFYSLCHTVHAPSHAYRRLLSARGYDPRRLSVFPRGVDVDTFAPVASASRESLGLPPGPTLLYVGRISRDKNVDLLGDIYERVRARREDVNLLVAGEGPALDAVRHRFAACPRVVLTGRVRHAVLPTLYAAADLFVFPSITDTFGMAALEAQACGVPALVSDAGGPQEIVAHGVTGWVLPATDPEPWAQKILEILELRRRAPREYQALRREARARVQSRYTWASFLAWIFGDAAGMTAATARPRSPRAHTRHSGRQLVLYSAELGKAATRTLGDRLARRA